jgi:hypothetical protein
MIGEYDMTNRTLQFLGLAFGDSAVTITATIDNVVVYNNTVATLNEPLVNDGTHWTTTNQLFTVENSDQFPIEFAGSRTMSVSVTGGEGIILARILSNYMGQEGTQIGNEWVGTPGNATTFVKCYHGAPTNSEGTPDCRSSVVIDGVPQVPDRTTNSQGIWTWKVKNGSTLVCNLNVSQGNVA